MSIEKTQIIFSRDVGEDLKVSLATRSGFSIANNLGRYLGAYIIKHQKQLQSYY